jgi:ubiquitin-like modifier-activating enzyme ATG7
MIASGVGVELLASLVQHPLGGLAPVTTSSSVFDHVDTPDHSILGVVPHQIRGFVNHHQTIQLSGTAYEHCTACSESVINRVLCVDGGVDFIVKALTDPTILEANPLQVPFSAIEIEDTVDDFDLVREC